MHKKLIIFAFEKAKKEEIKKGIKTPSLTHLAKNISLIIEDYSGLAFGEKSLRNYYNSAIKENEETNIKQPKVINALCQYLGYEDYPEFYNQKGVLETNDITDNSFKKESQSFNFNRKKIMSYSIIAIIIGYFGYDTTKKDCMIWVNNTHYELVSCDKKEDLRSLSKDQYILENFRRVKPDSTYPFFKINGAENLWYEKNNTGDLDYFTSYGAHPITGKTLKRITPYMIKTHIWKRFKR
ncbi:hypothetical protein [Olleya sp. Bg11-27]|uniref:hypothetical protein n=1 Tax=Olleya sp. Bg11-27 TaxID=2058135 RepID=UPI000C307391|nr:hypothetical protein [Olleya sp. Bg11-27]AUC76833.1 hypothetical protein CW732_14560 [Olleya sp. Bg11-27]